MLIVNDDQNRTLSQIFGGYVDVMLYQWLDKESTVMTEYMPVNCMYLSKSDYYTSHPFHAENFAGIDCYLEVKYNDEIYFIRYLNV
jgi:hypothetical protein